ncbi:MAG TPA: RNA methyltransferase [Burkholderiales bacterium]|nr:RNA methyltransferase [Burkholderiales bacterium]
MKTETLLARIRVVLSHTTHPGNIGAAARAIKTMGLSQLVLVNPRHFPDAQATAMASGADDVLAQAKVCATLDEALQGTRLAVAVTARRRDISHAGFDAREAAKSMLAEAAQGDVALVFGTEMSGLSNDEVMKCQRLAHIDANPEYSSLNLAAAVQVMAYELRRNITGGVLVEDQNNDAAAFEDIEAFYVHLEERLTVSGFLDPAQPKRLMERLRRLFGRARLEKEEVNILRGILTAWEKPKRR